MLFSMESGERLYRASAYADFSGGIGATAITRRVGRSALTALLQSSDESSEVADYSARKRADARTRGDTVKRHSPIVKTRVDAYA
jgi:hypothetical protein